MYTDNKTKCRRSMVRGISRYQLVWQSLLTGGIFLIATQGQALAQAISYTEEFTAPATFEDAMTTADWDTTAGVLKLPTATGSPVKSLNSALTPATASVTVDALDTSDTRAIAIGDLDGDGDLDLVFGNKSSPDGSVKNRIYLNDGFGAFPTGFALSSPYSDGGNSRSAVIADFNSDGYEDIAFAEFSSGQASYIMFNDGSGSPTPFSGANIVELGDATLKGNSITAGDIDGDGDMDIVLGIISGYVRVFRNDGFGAFEEAVIEDTGAASVINFALSAVLLGDLDQDGDLDIVAARDRVDTRIYLNDGSGNFPSSLIQFVTASGAVNTINSPDTIALGDVDGDGYLDLIVGNDGSGVSGTAQPNRLYLNSGDPVAGLFPTVSQSFTDLANTSAARLVDVDRDGDLDLITADFASPSPDVAGPNRLY
ncbi:MAG: VCBS repeat-containing protein, partial [Proteobacteria bacterium]|nr:VCBS repeat-containing protein [Pseudomonadota bacterium]